MILNVKDKQKWFRDRVNEVHKDKFNILSEYINTKTYVKLKCNDCGELIDMKPYNLLQGYGCRKCNKRKRITNEEMDEIFKKEGYTRISGSLENVRSRINIRHDKCGHEYSVTFNNFKNNKRRCPYCEGLVKKDIEYVRKFMEENYGDEYKLLSDEYKNKDSKLKFLHSRCKNISEFTFNNIRNGKFSCQHCVKSSGEETVSRILESMNIDYTYQKKFEDCKNTKVLPFDFFIEKDGKSYIIEYDGRHHFMPIYGDSYEEKITKMEMTRKNDSIKNKFCEDNSIKLLRLKYSLSIPEIKTKINNFLNN